MNLFWRQFWFRNFQVHSHPFFSGETEKHLLRTQIARIAASATICPKGYLVADEAGEITENEEFQFPNLNGLADISNWTHARPVINKAGLTAYPEFDAENEENTEDQVWTKLCLRISEIFFLFWFWQIWNNRIDIFTKKSFWKLSLIIQVALDKLRQIDENVTPLRNIASDHFDNGEAVWLKQKNIKLNLKFKLY